MKRMKWQTKEGGDMKTFVMAGTALAALGSHPSMADAALDAFRGTEMERRLQAEHHFLIGKYAELQAEGASGKLQHLWNPLHTIILFFDAPPPSGCDTHHFWAYRKKGTGEEWEKAGEYYYVSRYAPDWDRKSIVIEDGGFSITITDHHDKVTHFFDFNRPAETFYYRMHE